MLKEKELSDIVEHAKSRMYGHGGTLTDYSNPFNVIAYCSEWTSQAPFQLGAPDLSEEGKQRIYAKLDFFNGVAGRVAHLNHADIKSSSYSHFYLGNGKNQIDTFLTEIGYKIN